MLIRPLQAAETEAARQLLMVNGWQHRVADAAEFAAMLERSQLSLVAIDDDGTVIGFLRALSDGISNGYISMVVVAEGQRRRGIGRALVQAAMRNDARMTWVLRAARPGVVGFYERIGFRRSDVAMERPGRHGTAPVADSLVLGPELHRAADCEAVLRSLPSWFGIEHALRMYVDDTERLPTFALEDQGRLFAFLTLHEHFSEAWEIHCVAVHADTRGHGHGSRLLAHAERWLVQRGVRWLQVKTVAETSPSASYSQTRTFYAARGFAPIEIFPTLWDAHNPALQMIKRLGA